MSVRLNNSWDILLKEEWKKPYYKKLRKILIEEYKNYNIFPDMNDIFNCLKYVSYEDVKVVILGQDPYHRKGQAHGFSFSVKEDVKIPPSLFNIYKELYEDLNIAPADNGNLISWAKQGVLLLNTTLTVRQGSPNSHANLGWNILTDRIIELLNDSKRPLVFILWGNNARDKKKMIDSKRHLIIESAHPSPFSCRRGFFGSKPFSRTNDFLVKNKMNPIDWKIPDIKMKI